jgi:thioredoxin reductase (NADPH)
VSQPVLFAVDNDVDSLRAIERELVDRYERSYRIVCLGSAVEAEAELARSAAAGENVALVLAGELLDGSPGSDFLDGVRKHHPQAQRGLLIDYGSWGQPATGEAIFSAMALRQIDYYLIRPIRPPDEMFHEAVTTFLSEWAHARRVSSHTAHIVGESWSGRAYELREVLGVARFRTRSVSSTPLRGRISSPNMGTGSRCRWWSFRMARSLPIPATPS